MYQGCYGKPVGIQDLVNGLPTARELSLNIIKLPERVAWALLGYKGKREKSPAGTEVVNYVRDPKKKCRVSVEGDKVFIDGKFVYDRFPGRKDN